MDRVVASQREAGVTIVNDGEYGKAMTSAVDYGAWWSYSFQRIEGLSLSEHTIFDQAPILSEPGHLRLSSFTDRRDRALFDEAYSDPKSGISTGRSATAFPSTTGPISYRGQEAIASDVANLTAALGANGVERGFSAPKSLRLSRAPAVRFATSDAIASCPR